MAPQNAAQDLPTLRIKKEINSSWEFPTPDQYSEVERLRVDFAQTMYLSSAGILKWLKFSRSLHEVNPSIKVALENCPKTFIDQLNAISGLLPDQFKVVSFFVPFFAEEANKSKMILLQEGKDFDYSPQDFDHSTLPKVYEDNTNEEMILDVIPGNYFKFLKLK